MLSVDEINKLKQENAELKAENATYKANADAVYKYITQNEQLKTHIDGLEKKNAALKAENARLKEKIKNFEDKLQLRMASDKESDKYWDDIFSAEDYPFNKENAYKELQDYYFVLQQLPEIYLEITGGILSKTTYFASSVIEAYHDVIDRRDDEIDNLQYKNNEYKQTLQEIKKIAENVCRDDCSDLKNGYCIGLGACSFRARKQIIDLITKAEEEL